MNTTSNLKAFGVLAAALALGSCIQGPWDYYPKDPAVFRGIWVSAYAMAGKPIQQVCFERLLDLDEENTNAFAFYDSAQVTVTGRFGDSTGTLALSARKDAPNCFAGDTGAKVMTGHDYDLRARIVWDSAGRQAVHVLTARAQVPESFSIKDTAVAPRWSFTGGLPPNIFTEEFLRSLPTEAQQDTVLQRFFFQYLEVQNDSAARIAFIAKNGKTIENRLKDILGKEQSIYAQDSLLFYLGGILNTLSHYYTANRSADVGGVLITHRFDSTAERPETAFEGFFGIEPDSSEYYFEGSVRRLGMYPAVTSPKGYNLLDSIGVVNTWFHTGRNILYFYGMEQAYVDYIQTAIEGEGDPRIKPDYNVAGGNGFFVGGVPDSFTVRIKVDQYTKSFSMPAVHAYECREDGWDSNKDCATYYHPYCLETKWASADCGGDAVRTRLIARLTGDTATLALVDSAAEKYSADSANVGYGTTHFCVEKEFTAELGETCDGARRECNQSGVNGCKEAWWNHCKDNLWAPEYGCGPALAWYCRDKKRPSEVMCKQADKFCAANPQDPACK